MRSGLFAMGGFVKLISDKQLDSMKQQGWTPTQVWELIDSYKELKQRIRKKKEQVDNADGPGTDPTG